MNTDIAHKFSKLNVNLEKGNNSLVWNHFDLIGSSTLLSRCTCLRMLVWVNRQRVQHLEQVSVFYYSSAPCDWRKWSWSTFEIERLSYPSALCHPFSVV